MKFPHFVLVILAGISPWMLQIQGAVPQDTTSEIAKADDFYYQGRFTEALAILSPLDDKLTRDKGSAADESKIKMLIGLTQVALGDADQARTRFLEFCELNPNYVLDEQLYPRKVVTIFKDAQQECAKCVQICSHAESLVAAGDAQGALDLKADTEACGCAAKNLARDDAALQHGRELLAQEKYPEALKEFQDVLAAVPASAARRQAVEIAQGKIDLAVESAIAEWREQFSSRELERAAATYDRIRSFDGVSGPVLQEIIQVTARYQSTFQDLQKSWDAACSRNDQVSLNTIREWGRALDPNRKIQPTAMNRMGECAKPPAANANRGK